MSAKTSHDSDISMAPYPLPENRAPRIIICAVQIPFISGGAEGHIESLRRELRKQDYDVDIVRLPLKWYPPRQILNDALAWRMIDVSHVYGLPVDLVIATRFPSYVVKHPRKVAWVLHQHRQIYDLLNTEYTDFDDTTDDDEVRKLIYEMDRRTLGECQQIYANSRNVAHRMKTYLNIDSIPLYHPPPLSGRYRCDAYGDFLLTVGRLELNKRVDLLLKSLAHSKESIKTIVVGEGPQRVNLETLAGELGLSDRVKFTGYISDDELLNLYARCGAVFYAPLDEDYGYVTLEAFSSLKTVITTEDAGGVLEFVTDGKTGYTGKPEPEDLAGKIDLWYRSEDRGAHLGKNGNKSISNISWDNVISSLTSLLVKDTNGDR